MGSVAPIPIDPALLKVTAHPIEPQTSPPLNVTPTSQVIPLSFVGDGNAVDGPAVLPARTTFTSCLSPTSSVSNQMIFHPPKLLTIVFLML